MAQIFISFIHEESEYAEAVQAFITQILGSEVMPFLSCDRFQVYAGEQWIDRIMVELKEAKVVILMLSEKSVKRPWVNFEAGAAWTRGTVTIPVCIGRLKKDDLPKPYSSLQAVDLNNFGEDEYLASSVAHHLALPAPVGRMFLGLGALGGPESIRKDEAAKAAYEQLQTSIAELNSRFDTEP